MTIEIPPKFKQDEVIAKGFVEKYAIWFVGVGALVLGAAIGHFA